MTDTLHLEPEDDDETRPAELTLEEQLERLDPQQLRHVSLVISLLSSGAMFTEQLVNQSQNDTLFFAAQLGKAMCQ